MESKVHKVRLKAGHFPIKPRLLRIAGSTLFRDQLLRDQPFLVGAYPLEALPERIPLNSNAPPFWG